MVGKTVVVNTRYILISSFKTLLNIYAFPLKLQIVEMQELHEIKPLLLNYAISAIVDNAFFWHLHLAHESCEWFAYSGISMNLVTYMTTILHQGNAAAATNVNNWTGICYISPFIGAFLADEYLGRYWTIAGFSVLYFVVST